MQTDYEHSYMLYQWNRRGDGIMSEQSISVSPCASQHSPYAQPPNRSLDLIAGYDAPFKIGSLLILSTLEIQGEAKAVLIRIGNFGARVQQRAVT